MNRILIIIIGLLIGQAPLLGQGWIKTYYDYSAFWLNGLGQKTIDNGYVMVGHMGSIGPDLHIKKTDAFGAIQWAYDLPKQGSEYLVALQQVPSDGSYLILYHNGGYSPNLMRLDALGQVMYDIPINIGMDVFTGVIKSDMIVTSDEHILITSGNLDTVSNPSPTIGLAKLDLGGNVLWSHYYNHSANYQTSPMSLIEHQDGSYLMLGTIDTFINNNGNGADFYFVKTDTAGNELWRKTEAIAGASVRPRSIFHTSNGGFLVTGTIDTVGTLGGKMLIAKFDSNLTQEWDWNIGPGSSSDELLGAVENNDGTYTCTGIANYGAPFYRQIALVKLSATGGLLSNTPLQIGSAVPRGKQIYNSANGGHSIFGVDANGCFILTIDSLGRLYTNHVVGNYFYDMNGNCSQDIGEPTIANRIVTAEKATESRLGITNSVGKYDIEVDTGTYTIRAENLAPYWQFCQNPQTVTFTSFYSQDTIDFALEALDTCTYMEVEVSTPILRRCFPATYYVNYNNWGTADGQNVYVELTLDPYLTFDSSSIPMTLQTGNVYRFDIGNVPSITGGGFQVYVTVDCDSTVLGQVHCVEAHIYPDTICTPNYWNGPIIKTSSSCTNDSVTFRIWNIGTDMMAPHNYSIIEEHVMIHLTPFTLQGGTDQLVTIPAAPGAMYRIEAAQANGFPSLLGDSVAVSNNVGCNAPPLINFPGIVNQFYNGNSSPFVSTDCQANRGAYDPNDKQAQPLGYGTQHYIENYIPINYHIRFQNTGTDTAFTVVVIDTIDTALDPTSIQMGASSHPYTWELRENGILVVTFDNILLPDSNVNQLASNGFFKFEIHQKANNPVGTVIHNRAGIYFDFNPPVMTNQTFHTIGDNFVTMILTGMENVVEENISIHVFPNPFESSTTILVEGQVLEELEVEVLTAMGQLVKTIQVKNSNQLQLDRTQLTQGVYFYRLKGNKKLLNTGKLIVR